MLLPRWMSVVHRRRPARQGDGGRCARGAGGGLREGCGEGGVVSREAILADLRHRLAIMQRAAVAAREARASGGRGTALENLPLRTCDDRVRAPAQPDPRLLAALDAEGANLSRARVLDTETTGLAGGTGTLAFLI